MNILKRLPEKLFHKLLFFLFLFIIQALNNKTLNCYNSPIFFTSIPKSGTHLLLKCLQMITDQPFIQIKNNLDKETVDKIENYIYLDHYPYDKKVSEFIKDKFKCFIMVRDARDQLISLAHYIYKDELLKNLALSELNFENLISYLIKINHICYNIFRSVNIDSFLINQLQDFTFFPYLKWLKEKHFYAVKFENLVGPSGGGTLEKQIKEIENILKHLNIQLHQDKIKNIANNLWGNTTTFREGKIGDWKTQFTAENKNQFKKCFGKILIDLGYENDLNW